MRWNHIIGGQIVFGLGLFLVYLNSVVVVEIFKGAIQPVIIILGIIAIMASVFGKKEFRKPNAVAGGVLLALGIYGLYDEYYAVVDFIYGFLPLFLVFIGLIGVTHGIKQLK
ncbi:MAG: hypothetical protein HQK77_19180 [Desulfobacterales bacterium]|nr:hypothetical protein [Desulfobacterales bacterium]